MSVREHFDEVSEKIEAMLADMKYGSITIVVQDGKVIQLEKSEKVRLKWKALTRKTRGGFNLFLLG